MRRADSGAIVATASALAGCLLLAACSSSTGNPAAKTAAAQGQSTSTLSSTAPAATTKPSSAATAVAVHSSAACALITEADVTSTVATDPGKGSAASSSQVGATGCTYGSYPGQVLTVNVLDARGRAGYDRARHDPRLARSGGLGVVTVTGVGDQAFELSGPHTDAIYFTKGDALIVIGFTAPTPPPGGAALKLAKIAASRL